MKRALLVVPVVLAAPLLMACRVPPHKLPVQTSSRTASYGSTAAPSAPSGSRSHSTPPAQPKTTAVSPSKPCPKPAPKSPVAKPHPIPAKPPVHTSPLAAAPVALVVTAAPASGGIGTPVSISSPGPAALANTGPSLLTDEIGIGGGLLAGGLALLLTVIGLGHRAEYFRRQR